jgi:hypothetical protein
MVIWRGLNPKLLADLLVRSAQARRDEAEKRGHRLNGPRPWAEPERKREALQAPGTPRRMLDEPL